MEVEVVVVAVVVVAVVVEVEVVVMVVVVVVVVEVEVVVVVVVVVDEKFLQYLNKPRKERIQDDFSAKPEIRHVGVRIAHKHTDIYILQNNFGEQQAIFFFLKKKIQREKQIKKYIMEQSV